MVARNALGLMRGDGSSSFGKGGSTNESKVNIVKELRRAGIAPSYEGPALFPVRDDLIAMMVNHEYGYSALDAQQVTDATMHARAEETWLLADSSKYGRAGFVTVLPLPELTGVITDAGIGEESAEALRNAGIQVVVA